MQACDHEHDCRYDGQTTSRPCRSRPTRGEEHAVTEIFAHRGPCRPAGENAIAAFVAARDLGADGTEPDVHRSADGDVVVRHDGVLPGLGPIGRLLSAELPAWLPSPGEALDACWPLQVDVESKAKVRRDPRGTGLSRARWRDCWLLGRRHLGSWSHRLPSQRSTLWAPPSRALRRHCSSIRQAIPQGPSRARQHGHRGLRPFFLSVDADLMSAARASGTAIRAWTVDDRFRSPRSANWASTQSSPTTCRRPAGRSDGPACRAPRCRSTPGDRPWPWPSGWPPADQSWRIAA